MIRTLAAAVASAATAVVFACTNGTSDPGNCKSNYHLDTIESIVPGQVDMGGRIAEHESVLLRYTLNGGEPRTVTGVQFDTDTIVFGFLPAGSIQFTIVLSCEGGQFEVGSGSVTVR